MMSSPQAHYLAASARHSLTQINVNFGEAVFVESAQLMLHQIIDLTDDIAGSDKLSTMLYEAADFAATQIKVKPFDFSQIKKAAAPEPEPELAAIAAPESEPVQEAVSTPASTPSSWFYFSWADVDWITSRAFFMAGLLAFTVAVTLRFV